MTFKKLIIILLVLALVFGIFLFFKAEKEITNYPPKNQKVVAFGDSLVVGIGATEGNDFISRVEKNLNIKIENKGKSGDTTTSALLRINEALASDPGIVIILLGGNDVLQRIPKEETFRNLGTIIKKFQDNGTLVMLLGVRGGILSDAYASDFENLAEEYKALYVSNILKNIITNKELMSDTIHPNDKGYEVIADRVSEVLKKVLK